MPAEVDTAASATNTNAQDSPASATAAKFAPIQDNNTDETLRPSVENNKVDSTTPAKNGVASAGQGIAGAGEDDTEANNPSSYNNFDDDDDLDDDGDDNLTPPPDSPSPVPSLSAANNNCLQDEIVVGTKANGVKPSARVQPDQDDIDMVDADVSRGGSHYPKRKRNSMYASLEDDASDVAASPALSKPDSMAMLLKGRDKVRGITLGYWRDSEVPEKEFKHQVVGFIDVRDRLRTRVQATSRFGKIMTDRFPLPPGPGGSWVTFERIVFEDHLVHLDHEQIKEYVKVRGETWGTETTDEEVAANNSAAVKEAVARVQARPTPENVPFQQPIIAYGEDIPDHAKVNRAHEKKKRRLNSIPMSSPQTPSLPQQPSFTVDTPDIVPPPRGRGGAKAGTVYDDIPGTRPTKVVVGYWAKSQEADPKDKHAVYGVLGSNDMFRVKLVKHTRDGRAINGDFPSGPGAVWINWEEVVFEPHLRKLERAEIKEYCRIRQSHYDAGELPQDRISNETKAVHEAQVRVEFGRPQNPMAASQMRQVANEPMILPSRSQSAYQGTSNHQVDDDSEQPQHDGAAVNEPQNVDPRERPARHIVSDDNYDDDETVESGPGTGHELRQSRRSTMALAQAQKEIPRPARHSLPNASELRAANRRPAPGSVPVPAYNDSSDRMARVNSIAQQNLAMAESHQVRISQRQSLNGGNVNGGPYHSDNSAASFGAATSQMQRIWAMQEEQRLMPGTVDRPAPVEEIKVEVKEHAGITYARKKNGPFPGKLASNGTLISIDGEDYVEYRVLTKPSFTF
ncbi:hypothetical protein MGG_14870 [Pyricularia oryzae 70-15]|uniref:Uncharacterized protein n=1 Tax=Pyricularia oryzae (strain 70-15 / ATCC MYA-4617 / FGSC 8958) TaxID=242507 RepID=G4N9W6_PYRO7|nr:uncharacterized protein MGG_14870 [Pyricularia oryzae 70-15]EHA50418.1 hypothetical protein MGG_14870 [Pyricularia oryzae 70-15]KAI7931431.1 hypothetical protein M9X92_000262 [Pyricularia oryzae]KAI7931552.1 hypothetical protein M0657_001050 [Pyricularia oryzae]